MKRSDLHQEIARMTAPHPMFDPRDKLFHEFVGRLQNAYAASGSPFGDDRRAAALWIRYRTLTTIN